MTLLWGEGSIVPALRLARVHGILYFATPGPKCPRKGVYFGTDSDAGRAVAR